MVRLIPGVVGGARIALRGWRSVRRAGQSRHTGVAHDVPSSHHVDRHRVGHRPCRDIAGPRPAPAAPMGAGLHGLPRRERVEQEGPQPAGAVGLRHADRCDRCRPRPASGLLRPGAVRHPHQRGDETDAARAGALRLRVRVEPRALPHPGAAPHRARIRPTHAHARPHPLPPVRAVRGTAQRRPVGRGQRRRLEPPLEPSAACRLDLGRCRRPPHPPGPGAPRRGRPGRDPPRPAVHRTQHAQRLHLSGAALRRQCQPVAASDGAAGRRRCL